MSMVPEPEVPEPAVTVEGVGLTIEADPRRPWKAIAAAVASGLVGFVLYWVADEDPFTWKDAGEALVAGVAASGLVGGATFGVRNPLRSRPLPPL